MLWEIINQKEVIDDLTWIQSLRNLCTVTKHKIYMTNKPQKPIKQIAEKKWHNRYLAKQNGKNWQSRNLLVDLLASVSRFVIQLVEAAL